MDDRNDLDVIRCGGMPQLFGEVYACSTLGQFLREFTHRHALQLASVPRAHSVNLVQHSNLLTGIDTHASVEIDPLLRPVYGHAKQGASYGHTKMAGRQILRKGLSPLATPSAPNTVHRLWPVSGCGPDGPARARAPRRW